MSPYRFPLKFGKYLLTRRLAVGGMAEVFKAKIVGIKGFEKTIALKKILPEFNEDEEFVQMFVDEARISSHLYHGNIVQVFDFGVAEGSYYIAMEYVDGPNLKNFVQRLLRHKGHVPRNIAVYILLQIARGLDYAHGVKIEGEEVLNLVHRDISPQNILLARSGDVKITDFGIAKAAIKLSRTQPGKIQGKFSYMSPEQAAGKPLDRRSDIFSLGIIAYELLSGVKLYAAEDTQQRYKEVREARLRRLGELTPELPALVEGLVMRMLEKDPAERPQSCAEILAELGEVLNNISTQELARQLGLLVDEYFPRETSDAEAPARAEKPGGETTHGAGVTELDRKEEARRGETTKPIREEPTEEGRRIRPVWAVAAILASLAALAALLFYLSRERPAQTAAPAPVLEPTAEPAETPPPPVETAPPLAGRPADDARQAEAQERMRELEEQLEQTEQKAEETAKRLAETQAKLATARAEIAAGPCPDDMVFIREGEFLYGSERTDPDRNDLVEPEAHPIPLPKFCVDRYEYPNEREKEPITMVNWARAQTLCSSRGKRLCTQEEWERACKGPTGKGANRRYPYGNKFDPRACNTESAEEIGGPARRLAPSGTFGACASPEGVFDMSGNVDEWTVSRGQFSADSHVTRGGSKSRPGWASRCMSTRELSDASREPDVGFRCCKDAL